VESDHDEICRNVDGFISLLKTWDDNEKMGLENDRINATRNQHHADQTT
jgi:hypothetical protein